MKNVTDVEIERAIDSARREGTPVRLSVVIAAVRAKGEMRTSTDFILERLVTTAEQAKIAIEIDRH